MHLRAYFTLLQIAALAAGLLFPALYSSAEVDAGDDEYAAVRARLVREIEADVRRTKDYLHKSKLDDQVLEVMARVPRHQFVPRRLWRRAYENRPLPIGHGQTISQPYIVAIMTDLLELPADCRVLEVGTGSGYQAAVLAELCAEVYTIEIVEPLGQAAAQRLADLGYENVEVRIGDGYAGWQEHAPFDGVIVTAGASHTPPALVDQLKPGGRMVIPVGDPYGSQELVIVTKGADGRIKARDVLPVVFVPLTGGHDREQ